MTKKELQTAAKAGMTLSLGALAFTGMGKGRKNKALHVWSGIALIGFSVWHYNLYKPGTPLPGPCKNR